MNNKNKELISLGIEKIVLPLLIEALKKGEKTVIIPIEKFDDRLKIIETAEQILERVSKI